MSLETGHRLKTLVIRLRGSGRGFVCLQRRDILEVRTRTEAIVQFTPHLLIISGDFDSVANRRHKE